MKKKKFCGGSSSFIIIIHSFIPISGFLTLGALAVVGITLRGPTTADQRDPLRLEGSRQGNVLHRPVEVSCEGSRLHRCVEGSREGSAPHCRPGGIA